VRDAGGRIVHRIEWCTGYVEPGYEQRGRWVTRVESENGRDVQVDRWAGWYERGCWVTRLSYRDLLEYKGPYYGRARLAFKGQIIYTPWRRFCSS
jgi:hypothetical protein